MDWLGSIAWFSCGVLVNHPSQFVGPQILRPGNSPVFWTETASQVKNHMCQVCFLSGFEWPIERWMRFGSSWPLLVGNMPEADIPSFSRTLCDVPCPRNAFTHVYTWAC